MSYNPYPQYNPYPEQPPVREKSKEQSSWKTPTVLAAIVAAIASITVAWITLHPGATSQQPPPSFPLLVASYSGTLTSNTDGETVGLRFNQVNENQNTGAFTASANLNGCPMDVSGNVTQSGSLNFTGQVSSACPNGGVVFDFAGNITQSGSIGGNWSARTGNLRGTWSAQ